MSKKAVKKKVVEKKAAVHEYGGEYKVLDLIKVKPADNYRRIYKKEAMDELTESVKAKGVLQPILVSPEAKGFKTIAGERRRRAAVAAGLKRIPAIVKELSEADALEIQLIENGQREDVNPIEEALGFDKLIKLGKHTHETLAHRLGKHPAYIYGRISFLKLSTEAQKALEEEKISYGHALLLTRLRHPSEQKELLKIIFEQELSIKEAKEELKGFLYDIKNAVFDTAACDKCPFLSKNQTVLFPELKKTGECMDRGCFFAKTRDFYKAILDEKKKQGFKVFTDKKEVERLTAYNAKTSEKIYPPGSSSYHTIPKRYKSECMKCAEHHGFYACETERNYEGKHIEFGEICLNKKCLDRMQGMREAEDEKSGSGNSAGTSDYKLKEHARNCRDRFLRATLPAKVDKSEPLRLRLMIYNLIKEYGSEEMEALVKQFNPKYKYKQYAGGKEIYAFVLGIPEDMLVEAAHKILIATIQETDPEVLLRMTLEAGIDMSKDFGPDEAFLNSKTKDELVKFVSSHKLAVEVKETDKKGAIIKSILTQDLKGKLTKECVEVCKI